MRSGATGVFCPAVSGPTVTRSGAHAAVPLTILESLRHLDAPADGGDEYHQELAVKRLGMSGTVAAQIERYRRLAGRGGRVELE